MDFLVKFEFLVILKFILKLVVTWKSRSCSGEAGGGVQGCEGTLLSVGSVNSLQTYAEKKKLNK